MVIRIVVMPNHIHFLWAKRPAYEHQNVLHHFLRFTAQSLKFYLLDNGLNDELQQFKSTQSDREYHIWERRRWKARMPNKRVFEQKLNYIHNNPVKAGVCQLPEEYIYSSARFYSTEDAKWPFLSHYLDHF